MCKVDPNFGGYQLKSGKYVTPDNVETLSREEIKELLDTQTTAWDFLMLRKSHHALVNSINSVLGQMDQRIENINDNNKEILKHLQNIESKLTVTLKNGKAEKRDIGEVVVELWDLHKPNRDRKRLKDILYKYKLSLILIFVIMFFIGVKFHNQLNYLFSSIESFLFAGISASLVLSTFIAIIRILVNHKNKE